MVAFKEVPGPSAAASEPALTSEAAQRQIAETMAAVHADPKHPYLDVSSPMHRYAVEDFRRLHEIAYPEGREEVPPGYDHIRVAPGQELNPAGVEEFRAEAQKLGLPIWEADVWIGELFGPEPRTPAPTREIGETVLWQQWAEHYQENLALARAFLDRLPGDKDDPNTIRGRLVARFGNHPATVVRCCELERTLRARTGA